MSDNPASPVRRCFVVMGFGVKTDLATGRKLDLDKSYRALIKPVVESKGLACVRADEIRHSGTIDVPMYEELLTADLVVADISTANPNAIYELGIRHALRPRTTVVISESKLGYPFDLNHIAISSYTHLGDVIDYDEVLRFQKVLSDTLDSVLANDVPDSPVYTYLKLTPPALAREAAAAVARAGEALQRAGAAIVRDQPDVSDDRTLAALVEQGEQAIRDSRFSDAKAMFAAALHMCKGPLSSEVPCAGQAASRFRDPYLLQRLVLSTYKEEQPSRDGEVAALHEAKALLVNELALEDSNDPETIGLAGAIEKRLFEIGAGDLTQAIEYYARGYFLRHDRYNGINLAFLLSIRSDTDLSPSSQDKIADLVWANRIRGEVLTLCIRDLAEIANRQDRGGAGLEALSSELRARDWEEQFWCLSTEAEAHLGLGQGEDFRRVCGDLASLTPQPAAWMWQTFHGQISKLNRALQHQGALLDPPWPRDSIVLQAVFPAAADPAATTQEQVEHAASPA
jgi:hypothetical protein